jgi:CBS domain-containing protein
MASTLPASVRLYLQAETAADLMTANPVSISDKALVAEAIAFLMDRAISAAPVIDEAGRPVGVITRSDLLRHDRERGNYLETHEYYEDTPGKASNKTLPEGFHVELAPDLTEVRDIMTPVVFGVAPTTAVTNVIEEMLARKVHRLFVIDGDGVLVGVISSLDVLRKLRGIEAT